MRYLILILLLTSFQAHAVETDKAAHFGLSYAMTNVMLENGWSKPKAFFATLAIGAMKEAIDKKADKKDMLANALGSGAAVLVFRWEF